MSLGFRIMILRRFYYFLGFLLTEHGNKKKVNQYHGWLGKAYDIDQNSNEFISQK